VNRNSKKGQVLFGSTLARKSHGKNAMSSNTSHHKSSLNDRKSFVMMKTLKFKSNKQDALITGNAGKNQLGKSGKLDTQLHLNKERMK
jgi:hypothetical protein